MSERPRKIRLKLKGSQPGHKVDAPAPPASVSDALADDEEDALTQRRPARGNVHVLDDDDDDSDDVRVVPSTSKTESSKPKVKKPAKRPKRAALSDDELSEDLELDMESEPELSEDDDGVYDDDSDVVALSEDDYEPGARRKPAAQRAAAPTAPARKRKAPGGGAARTPRLPQLPAAGAAAAPGSDDEDGGTGWRDFRSLKLKEDHAHRPLWVTPDLRIFLETFSPVYKQAYDFLIAIAEPQSRPEYVHEYALTVHSLYAAVSVGLPTDTIVTVLNRLSKNVLDRSVVDFVKNSTSNYGKVKLVLQRNKFFVESPDVKVLRRLLQDDVIHKAAAESSGRGTIRASTGRRDAAAQAMAAKMVNIDLTKADEEEGEEQEEGAEGVEQGEGPAAGASVHAGRVGAGCAAGKSEGVIPYAQSSAVGAVGKDDVQLYSFEVDASQVEYVKARCLPGKGGLNYPMLEEYDFRNDTMNADIPYELKPIVKHRPYQEKGLAKMFGNGRARSGIIVLPCGAGKSLTGISAAVRVRKSCLVLVTNAVSVDQWRHQFKLWTTIQDGNIGRFTSSAKEMFAGPSGVMICTYTMIAGSVRKRSAEGQRIYDLITNHEWGLILLDEVHVVPAEMFRKVVGIIKSHCKLGLTATLVREDSLITDLNFLIGPKLYEANWLDLTRAGHIANVQCCEVWCEMTKEFYAQYLREPAPNKRYSLAVMNPNKFRACEFLVRYHEQHRNDKIIVFSDNIFALKEYAVRMRKPFLYGGTGHNERTQVLSAFKRSTTTNTVFLSKVGDNSLDIPEANVLIQISSHAGSRRQEAQRLGRILRAKKEKPGMQPSNEFNAFFYTLVSKDTQEMFFSTKRQRFLIDQGYSFKVMTNLLDASAGSGVALQLGRQEEQLDLLAKVVASGEAAEALEKDADEDGLPAQSKSVIRRKGTLKGLSGADAVYKEFARPASRKAESVRRMVDKRQAA